jgi:uncharacterized iron-regulated membrane protein
MSRRVVFWCHLVAGLFAGIVVFIMSITGVILTYEKQMLAWSERRAAAIDEPQPGTAPASIDAIVQQAILARPGARVTSVARRSDPQAPVTVALSGDVTLLVHPYTARVIGEAPTTMRRVFRLVTSWHRYLAGTGESRAVGKAITGACNLAFLFLVLSGLYLWIPRRWGAAALRAVMIPRWRHATGKGRDFNWHNALGFLCGVPLAIVVASATVISYPWASELSYRLAGDTPPRRPAGPPGAAREAVSPDHQRDPTYVPVDLETYWQTAESQVRPWTTINLRWPPDPTAPLVFTIDSGSGGQPQRRGTLTIVLGQVATPKWETFADQSAGRRFRSMLRFAHTGEYWGVTGQTIAGIVSAAACVLVWTGFALAWRRFSAWRKSDRRDAVKRAA